MVIGNFSFANWGGARVVANYLIKEYKKAGHEVQILGFYSGAAGSEEKNFWGDSVKVFKTFSGRWPRVFSQFLDIYNPRSAAIIKREIKNIRPDAVHMHNVHKEISAYSVKIIHDLKIPIIITFHEFWALSSGFNFENDKDGKMICRKPVSRFEIRLPFRNFLIKRFVSRADFIFVPSDFARQKFLERGYSGEKVKRIYNGVDINQFSPKKENLEDGKNVRIIFVGRPTKKKGIEFLKETVEGLVQSGISVELEIIGGENGVSYDKLPDSYRKADVCVQPSLVHETFGLTVAEAMACGLPVVVTDMGGMPEVLGDAGIVVKAEDVENLKEALKDLILNPQKRKLLGGRGRKRAEELFDWKKIGQEYLEYIKKIQND